MLFGNRIKPEQRPPATPEDDMDDLGGEIFMPTASTPTHAPAPGSAAPGTAAAAAAAAEGGLLAGAKPAADTELWCPIDAGPAHKRVEDLLSECGKLAAEVLEQARRVQSQTPGKSMTQVLLSIKPELEEDIARATAECLGMDFESPTKETVSEAAFELLPPDWIRRQNAIPLTLDDGVLVVGLVDPTNVFLLDEVRRRTKKDVRAVVVTASAVRQIVEQMTAGAVGDVAVDDIIKDMADDDVQVVETKEDDVADLEKAGSESPVIRFVNYLIADAIKNGASDIHIEPKEKALKVRYRIDGILFESMNPPHHMQSAIISRLKIMANLDIAERRLPQDGRIRAMVMDRKIDLRMSTLPTVNGEKVVIRILDNRSINVPLENLGFNEDNLATWRQNISEPHGIVLVTGPTGSGKTTTLYSSLRVMDGGKLNISTVEDPVEYHLGHANQVQVVEKIGMTFSAALRSLLRQDPDVVMIGEIRDAETARIAVQASLTGHMVLSTLHTNDAPSSITRLINIGVEPYLISAALTSVLAQRLVRKICPKCTEPYEPTDEQRKFYDKAGYPHDGPTFKGAGCDKCRKTGYAGRLGIYELLVMTDKMRDITTRNPDVTKLRKLCREEGLVTLREDGFAKVRKGLTTIDEVIRVTESE